MKFKLAILVLIAVLATSLYAAPPQTRRSAPPAAARIDNATYINANKILMFVTNHGNFGRDLSDVYGYDAGTFYPYPGPLSHAEFEADPDKKYPLYAAGLWVGGEVNGETRVAIAEYSDEYVPGPMADGTFQPDWPEFRIYKLWKDSLHNNPNQDYLEWPVDQGAPTRIDTIDGVPTVVPAMFGDQMLWSVYNDASPIAHDNDAGFTEPLGLEIQHTTFAFMQEGPLSQMVFFRLRVFNKGENTIENCFFSLWADPDLGDAADDLVGSDTTLSLGYVYNADNDDSYYGSAPPALGFDFFQGPLIETGDLADTARMWDTVFPGFVNMGMYSFNKYINGTDPNDASETYFYMQGLESNGDPYEYGGNELLYVHTGDPVTGTGDLDINPADRRWMQSTGPVTFAPGDSTEIIVGIIVGQGGNRLQSITQLKELDKFAQRVYENSFQVALPPVPPDVHVSVVPGEVILNWGDTSEIDHGTYPFQGYTVWQCASGDCIELATFDIIDSVLVQAVIDTAFDTYSSTLQPVVLRALDNKGLRYQYRVTQDAFTGFDIWDVTTYQFRVTAFSFAERDSLDSVIVYGDRFKESATAVTVTPQDYLPGVSPVGDAMDVLEVEHVTGISGVDISPYILDPLGLTGHTYMVTFDSILFDTVVEVDVDGEPEMHDTLLLGAAFTLTDLTTDEVLLLNRRNLTGQDRGEEPYMPTDNFQLVVTGGSGLTGIREVAGAGGAVIDPSDNVMYSLNSTGDWYVDSDQPANFDRINWRGLMGISDWEFRWGDSSYAYDWNTDMPFPDKAPFSVWNVGIGTFDDPSDDVRLQFAFLDDDTSGEEGPSWTYGDRVYVVEREYVDPLPAPAEYIFPDEFEIGRIKFQDNSGETTSPAAGTVVRFMTAKPATPADTFTFVAALPVQAKNEAELDGIRVVPNPFYLFGPYDAGVGAKTIRFHGLPAECTIDIYNLAGELVEQLSKDDPMTSVAEWDALTSNGLPVASGIYIYVVDAPGFGQKIGKFAVFTETEVLRQY